MKKIKGIVLAVCMVFSAVWVGSAQLAEEQNGRGEILLDDFEGYPAGGLPTSWQYLEGRDFVPLADRHMREDEYFVIKEEKGNNFVRAFTRNQAHRIFLSNGDRFDWDLTENPRLHWRWRALKLPEGAREDVDRLNDTGGAVYVTFSRDWLGRPRSIKYTYSSTLPVGTVVSYGVLKVLVVSSAVDGTGKWVTVERDVVEDYRWLFGGEPPERPIAIFLWSDSDSVDDTAEVDFDDLMLLPPKR